LIERSAVVPGDLDDDEVVRPLDAEIGRVDNEVVPIVLTDDLKAVPVRNTNTDHRLVNDATDILPIGRVLALEQIDPNERHHSAPFRVRAARVVLQW
jgi:hypothetical protein